MAGPLTWNVENMFKLVLGVRRAVDVKMLNGCSRSCVAYIGTFRWNIELMLMVVRGVGLLLT